MATLSIEPDETFTVDLTDPVNAEIEDAQAEGEILNDDSYWWFYLPLISNSQTLTSCTLPHL